ncbi:undecaprenyl/decaprenyl-phosphate alpha-N-acetylglucosaminyl 1-phosphate transferase [candidate division KSB1 bacterium]|nr:undecaprenyl/decaprenyl-phosphate alpha-N-acetylglucosaminyl 1-phosphate transferase [candidate division KSB1 bacterium]
MRWFLFLAIFMESFALSWLLVPGLIRIADRFGVVDKPGERKVHNRSKPLLGGVAIFSAFFFVVTVNVLAFAFLHQSEWLNQILPSAQRLFGQLMRVLPLLIVILAGGFFMHTLGLIDDIYKERVTWKPKFVIQFVVALGVVLAGVRTHFMPGQALDVVVSVLWIVGITNSFNLLDNLDGLTAGVTVIAALLFFALAMLQGQIFIGFILVALAGAAGGFLPHNFYPSRLFMGDSGSLFLGYMFGTLTVLESYVVESSPSLLPIFMPLLILSIPLYDTFSVMFIRWREKRPLFEGDKRHFSHRLLELGMTHRESVIFIYLICFGVGLTATLLPYISLVGGLVLVAQAIVVYGLITILIRIGKRRAKTQ